MLDAAAELWADALEVAREHKALSVVLLVAGLLALEVVKQRFARLTAKRA